MGQQFKVGDICIAIHDPSWRAISHRHLAECEIVGPEALRKWVSFEGHYCIGDAFLVDFRDGRGPKSYERQWLRLKRPKSWDKFIFDVSEVQNEKDLSCTTPQSV